MSTARFIAALLVFSAAGCTHAPNAGAGPTPSPTLPVTTGNYPAYGHATDFVWIAGRLIRSSPAGQCTYLIFSTGARAPWGGRIALEASNENVERFPDGDMVVVTGVLDSRPLDSCGSPAMRVRSIEEH